MAAVISNGGGYYSTFGYLSEVRRMGLKVLPPDINESEVKYTGKDKEIRVGSCSSKRSHRREWSLPSANGRNTGPSQASTIFSLAHPAMSISRTCVFSSRQAALILSPMGKTGPLFCGRPCASLKPLPRIPPSTSSTNPPCPPPEYFPPFSFSLSPFSHAQA